MDRHYRTIKERFWGLRSLFPFIGIFLILALLIYLLQGNIVYVIFLSIFLILFAVKIIRHLWTFSNDKITEIFYSLQKQELIDRTREIKPSKNVTAFKADVVFFNTIFYDPRCCVLDENSIRFVLLHEEGHIIKKQFSKPPLIIFLILILIPVILVTVNTLTNKGDNFISTILPIIVVCYTVLFLFSLIKILNESLRLDEFQSDEFAARILRDNFSINNPSKVADIAFIEIRKLYEKDLNEKFKDSFVFRLIVAIANYHPKDSERVKAIEEQIDEKR